MKYFTKEEARMIIRKNGLGLCCNFDNNPNLEAAKALYEAVNRFGSQPYFAAALGFALGRATGIREERARRGAL